MQLGSRLLFDAKHYDILSAHSDLFTRHRSCERLKKRTAVVPFRTASIAYSTYASLRLDSDEKAKATQGYLEEMPIRGEDGNSTVVASHAEGRRRMTSTYVVGHPSVFSTLRRIYYSCSFRAFYKPSSSASASVVLSEGPPVLRAARRARMPSSTDEADGASAGANGQCSQQGPSQALPQLLLLTLRLSSPSNGRSSHSPPPKELRKERGGS